MIFFLEFFCRKDSFITHRAFCDALAEESARVTTVGGNSLNFGNDMGGGLMNYGGAAEIQHLGGGFRPEFGGNSMMGEQQKPRLSLWLDQANSQLNHMDHGSNLFSSSSTGLNDMIQMATNNLFGSNSSVANYANLSLSPLPPTPQMKEEPVSNKGSTAAAAMADSLASLYSDGSKPSAMSATALLQKAAQMGSTKSSPAFFGNSVGVMNSSSPSSSSTTNALPFGTNPQQQQQNRSELHQVFGRQQPENPAAVSAMMNFGNGLEHQNVNGGQANPVSLHSGLHGFTRDFLGMGGDGGGGGAGPFLPQELAKFASMSSAMGLSHYTGNH